MAGNELMAAKNFQGAYHAYTEAIRLKPSAIFYGNRYGWVWWG